MLATLLVVGALGTACTSAQASETGAGNTAATSGNSSVSSSASASGSTASAGTFLSSTEIHDISLQFDETAYDAMVATLNATGDKEWIEATVTIDGTTYEQVGIRLKGNSSLRSIGTDATASSAESLPWLIRLDKYVDGQNHDGVTDLVVRANTSETALNEAVALDLLRTAGLASEQAALVRFTANGSSGDLRLVIENLDDAWQDANFEGDGVLYKAEASGDYTYRGDDVTAYDDVFDQETGDEDNLEPLIGFLDFVNNADDASFAAELSQHLDVTAFARYLAFETLIDNFDDIDGPGNNSYLHWDAATGVFTVVAWDHNLAFGTRNTMGGAGGAGGPGAAGPGAGGAGVQRPAAMPAGGGPASAKGGAGGVGGNPMGGSNPLVERFTANSTFAALVTQATADLTAELYTSGAAETSLQTWSDLITTQASDLVDAATVTTEASTIKGYFS